MSTPPNPDPPQPPSVRAVIFDLDGTLYSGLRRVRVATSVRLWRSLGLLRRLERGRKAIRSHRYADESALHTALGEALAQQTGQTPARCRQWYVEGFMPAFVRSVGAQGRVRPHIAQLLDQLARRGIARSVVSDYGQISERLEALGIDPARFDFVCSAEEAGALKPSDAGFLAAARALGCDPSECLVVGDRADTDGVAAGSAGMHFWQVVEDPSTDGASAAVHAGPMRARLTWAQIQQRVQAL